MSFLLRPADEVGLIGHHNAAPDRRGTGGAGHAEAPLPCGVPAGTRTRRDRCLPIAAPGLLPDAAALLRPRPEYIRAGATPARRRPATPCLVQAGRRAGRRFAGRPPGLARHPHPFLAVGRTRAQPFVRALVAVGAMTRRRPAPGSPDALFRTPTLARPDAALGRGCGGSPPGPDRGGGIRLDPA